LGPPSHHGARRLIRDSRRLTGVNLLFDGPGAILDVAFADDQAHALLDAWERSIRCMLSCVGWHQQVTRMRRVPGGAMLFLSAPLDALYSATEINEWAWSEAEREVAGQATAEINAAAEALAAHLAREQSRAPAPHKPRREAASVLVSGARGKSDVARLMGAILGNRKSHQVTLVPRDVIIHRGLPVAVASAALITNAVDEHAGDLPPQERHLAAETMLVVSHVVPRLILSAEDRLLVDTLSLEQQRDRTQAAIGYFSLDPAHPVIVRHLATGGTAAVLSGGQLVFAHGAKRTIVCAASDAPGALGGIARHAVANALGAILLASAIGIPKRDIVRGLRGAGARAVLRK
jgi:hypothetical protein